MASRNHHNGGKIRGKHTTIIDAAKPIIKFLNELEWVTGISLGFIKSGLKGAKQRMKIINTTGGLLLVIRGGVTIQEIRVYSNNTKKVQEELERNFS